MGIHTKGDKIVGVSSIEHATNHVEVIVCINSFWIWCGMVLFHEVEVETHSPHPFLAFAYVDW
jgi:hypothetical protein